MKLQNQILLGLGIVVAVGGLAALVASTRETPESRPSTRSLPVVDVLEVHAEPFDLRVRGHGEVRARRNLALTTQVPGRVEWVSPDLVTGGFVDAGEELLRLETADLEVAVTLAEADLVRQETALALEQAQADTARAEWERSREGEPTALALRQPQLAEARARVRAAEATADRARLDLARAVVRAPFAARVRSQSVAPGRYVTPGVVLAELASTDVAEVVVPVRDEDLAHLDLPLGFEVADARLPVELSARFAGARRTWDGHVARVDGELDPRSRMARVVVEVDDPFGRERLEEGAAVRVPLLDGLFVEAELRGRTVPDAILLPRHALRLGDRVWVVVPGDPDEPDPHLHLSVRQVEVPWRDRDRAVVTGGLESGDLVVVSPLAAPVEGMGVRVGGREE